MKMRLLTATIAAFLFLAGIGLAMNVGPRADPMPPTKLFGLYALVGSVASEEARVELTILVVITPAATVIKVQLKDQSMLGGETTFPADDVEAMAAAMSEASEAVFGRRSFTTTIGSTTVSTVSTGGGSSAVLLKIKQKGFTLSSDSIQFDADNADSLSRLLRRTDRIIAWLEPRLTAMHPDSELPLTIRQEQPE